MAVSANLDSRAHTKKRGLFRRNADPEEVADRLERMIKRLEKDAVDKLGWKKDRFIVTLDFHHAAPNVKLTVEPDGEIRVRATTVGIGPGYHVDVVQRLDHVLDELEFVWADSDSYVTHRDVGKLQVAMATWLAELLHGDDQVTIGMPSEHVFRVDAPVLTALGPRDAAWRKAVVADPLRGADAFAWWQPDGAGHAERASALLAMWLEVPWREPLDKVERAVMKRVDAELRIAHKADRDLELPWADWSAMLGHLGVNDKHADRVRARAGDAKPTIGYRRYDMEVELSGGWTAAIGGGFLSSWEDDGAKFWATDGDRSLEFTSITANAAHTSDELLAIAPERFAVVARLDEGERRGRAEAQDDSDGVHVVHGLMAEAPHVGILTCKGKPSDQPWALATWRSLTRVVETPDDDASK